MMVIQGTSAGITGNIHPADRCTWSSAYSSTAEQYEITNAQFYPGNAAAIAISNAELGFIGKSGRFVAISG